MNTRRAVPVVLVLLLTGVSTNAGPEGPASIWSRGAYLGACLEGPASTPGLGPQAKSAPPVVAAAPPPWLANLTAYLEAVTRHTPGKADLPARTIAGWTGSDLEEVWTDLTSLVALWGRELRRPGRQGSAVYRDTVVTAPELRAILGLTDEEAKDGNINRIEHRAAILHADAVMLVIPLLPRGVGCTAASTVLVQDGGSVGSGCISIHWNHGRTLLDAVRPDPGGDATVRLWYRASIAYLLEVGDFANSLQQIVRARMLFPRDAGILLERGFYQEAFASPLIQPAAYASGVDRRGPAPHLREAESLYRDALESDPGFIEARVRRGHVLGELGRHREAAEELRLAATDLRSAAGTAVAPELRYYAELFLGREEESLGSRDAAREHYTTAAQLYPLAQTPCLALAHLARGSGDRAGSSQAMQQLLGLPFNREMETDPWWSYHRVQGDRAAALFAALYAPFLAGEGR